jgi:hypothetical protein
MNSGRIPDQPDRMNHNDTGGLTLVAPQREAIGRPWIPQVRDGITRGPSFAPIQVARRMTWIDSSCTTQAELGHPPTRPGRT